MERVAEQLEYALISEDGVLPAVMAISTPSQPCRHVSFSKEWKLSWEKVAKACVGI